MITNQVEVSREAWSATWWWMALPAVFGYLLFAIAATSASAAGLAQRIVIVQSGSSPVYRRAADASAEALAARCEDGSLRCPIPRLALDTEGAEATLAAWPIDVMVTLGRDAASKALVARPRHVLHALIPKAAYDELAPVAGRGAVYLDQPLARQWRLIEKALPGARRVGLLVSAAESPAWSQALAREAPAGLQWQVQPLAEPQRLGVVLKALLGDIDVLLAVPDAQVHNSRSVVSVLLTSYRERIPVVAFSEAYVSAGALAAVYSTPEQIGRQVGDLLGLYLDHPQAGLPPPEFPRYFSVSVNYGVARSLKLTVPGVRELEQMLQKEQP